jgi:hypothetical protein
LSTIISRIFDIETVYEGFLATLCKEQSIIFLTSNMSAEAPRASITSNAAAAEGGILGSASISGNRLKESVMVEQPSDDIYT